jgi:LmbE family N-acetylglucosaminyl deacetylase
MIKLALQTQKEQTLKVLCLGAHCDDIAIGCGGTILSLIQQAPVIDMVWVSLTSTDKRKLEEHKAAEQFMGKISSKRVIVKDWRDGYLPHVWEEVKEFFEKLKHEINPDLVLTHYRDDRHQDHRVVSDLTWNTFRGHLILEYEIPKYDGDMGSPNVFVPLEEECCKEKARRILDCFPSQVGRQWFTEDIFLSLARLRGMEANSSTSFAEAFYCRKLLLG